MAQIKRKKVNSQISKGQKKDSLLRNKKFWIIFSSIFAGLVIIGVTIGLIVYFNTKSDDNEVQDYFGGEATNLSYEYGGKNVSFTKTSYDGVLMHSWPEDNNDGTFVRYIFVFATDLSTFYPDKAIDDGKDKDDEDAVFKYNKSHNELFNQLVYLQYNIDRYNESVEDEEKAALYIVDTSIGDNNSIYADSKYFGGSDDAESSALFALLTEDGPVESFKDNNKEETLIRATSLDVIKSTSINSAVRFMNDFHFVSNED